MVHVYTIVEIQKLIVVLNRYIGDIIVYTVVEIRILTEEVHLLLRMLVYTIVEILAKSHRVTLSAQIVYTIVEIQKL